MRQRWNKDHNLPGHAPRDPFASPNALSDLSQTNSDVDFNDVFGGPPTRYSRRHSVGEPGDGYAFRGGEDDGEASRPWSSLGEKPVFGGISSPARRRILGDDFFNDIFRGSDSVCSSPRKPDRDLFSSTPGSRVLSPTHPLPPRYEPFPLSPSMRLTKGSDHPAFSSPTHHAPSKRDGASSSFHFLSSPTACVPSIATGVIQTQGDPRTVSHTYDYQISLSHQLTQSQDRSSEATESTIHETNALFKKDSTGSEVHNSSSEFHFSIYKWASKGVTLVMPANPRERKKESRFSALRVPVSEGSNRPTDAENMSPEIRALQNPLENKDHSSSCGLIVVTKDDISLAKKVEDALPAKFDMKFVPSDITKEPGKNPELSMDDVSHHVETYSTTIKEVPVSTQEAHKVELMDLRPLSNFGSDIQGNEDIIKHAQVKECLVKDNSVLERRVNDNVKIEERTGGKTAMNHVEVTSHIGQGAPDTFEKKVMGSRVKGKVKEFIKIFNQEASPKPIGVVKARGWRSRIKGEGKDNIEEQLSACVAKEDEEMVSNRKDSGAVSDVPIGDQISYKTEKAGSDISSESNKDYGFSPERNDTSVPLFESTLESFETSFTLMEETHFEDLEECLVEQLFQDQNELPQTDLRSEEIHAADAKIREWSKGREGNIRSLLSTLQYVLWPESGWKAVPLVDIIEGSSVKRAYQKALLCLHPDKLQQKGVSIQQKYIAEKIFDILQEAWIHFNSLSTL